MTAAQVQNQAIKMNISIKEPQAYLIATAVNHPETRRHFMNTPNRDFIKLFKSLTA